MKSNYTLVALSAALLLLLAFNLLPGDSAGAQTTAGGPAGRYQVSAYAGVTGGSIGHGCYILDTATGEVWHTRHGGQAAKVSDRLP
jgi:hypothetical protein